MQWAKPYPDDPNQETRITQIPENELMGPVIELRPCTMKVRIRDPTQNKPALDSDGQFIYDTRLALQAKVPAWGDIANAKEKSNFSGMLTLSLR